jgi:hypothetical protein
MQVDLPRAPHTPWGVIRDWLQQAKQLKFTDQVKQVDHVHPRVCRHMCQGAQPCVLTQGQGNAYVHRMCLHAYLRKIPLCDGGLSCMDLASQAKKSRRECA